MLTGT